MRRCGVVILIELTIAITVDDPARLLSSLFERVSRFLSGTENRFYRGESSFSALVEIVMPRSSGPDHSDADGLTFRQLDDRLRTLWEYPDRFGTVRLLVAAQLVKSLLPLLSPLVAARLYVASLSRRRWPVYRPGVIFEINMIRLYWLSKDDLRPYRGL